MTSGEEYVGNLLSSLAAFPVSIDSLDVVVVGRGRGS